MRSSISPRAPVISIAKQRSDPTFRSHPGHDRHRRRHDHEPRHSDQQGQASLPRLVTLFERTIISRGLNAHRFVCILHLDDSVKCHAHDGRACSKRNDDALSTHAGRVNNTHSSEHLHTGGERAPIAPHRCERTATDRPQTCAEHNENCSPASTTRIAPLGPSSPPRRSRGSLTTSPSSPIPTHTGSGPPGARRASPPVTAPGAGVATNAPHSHAVTAPIRIKSRRVLIAPTLRTLVPAVPPRLSRSH